ncbi:MAG: VWA domain-containing protein [Acidobacteriota bacterium]
MRRAYLAEIDQNADDQTLKSTGGASNRELDIQHEMTVRRAVAEEYQVITRQRDKLTRWVSDRPKRDTPRVLLLVGDGFDLDPREFYLNGFKLDSSLAQMRNELQSFDSSKDTESLAKLLSASGWTALTVSPGYLAAGFATDASVSGSSKVDSFLKGSSNQNAEPVTLFSHPLDPMRMYAVATGGTVLTDPNKLAGFSDELGKRVRVTYQVSRSTTGEVHRIQVKSNRPGLHVEAPQWSGQVASEDISSSRARSLLAGDAMKGDLPVRCEAVPTEMGSSSKKKSTTIRAIVDFSPLASLRDELRATTVRVSVGVDIPSALPTVTHQLSKNVDLSAQSTFVYEAPVNYRQGSRTASIVVEETATGAWGGCTASLDGEGGALPGVSLAAGSSTGVEAGPVVSARDSAWATAFARARTEGKLVFVAYPLDPGRTPPDVLEMRTKTLADDAVKRRLSMFVYLDDTGGASRVGANKPVTFAVFDPMQTPIATWKDMVNSEGLVSRLDAILRGAGEFMNAANLLAAGQKAEADLARGIAYNHSGRPAEAGVVLSQGRSLAGEEHKTALAQRIDIQLAWSWALQHDSSKAMAILEDVSRAPATPEIGAAASFAIGSLRFQVKDMKAARDAFRIAATLAPADSDLHRMAVEGYRNAGGRDDLPGAVHIDGEAIAILPPSRAVLSGRTTFRTIVNNPDVKRVEFLLDGTTVADRQEPPFEARIDLGGTPRLRSLEVVAYGADGARIGAAQLDVNSRPDNFSVHILSPQSATAAGALTFEASATPPSGHHIVRMEVYWNDSLVTRMTAPPFRRSLNLTNLSSGGYLRAVALLEDGRSAEDVHPLNVAGVAENLDVRLVELFLSIEGAPAAITSLTKNDFEIREDGVSQSVQALVPAKSIPLTLGVAIDSSASMKDKLPAAQDAAARFIENSISEGDQAFLIDFDSRPRLTQSATGDVQLLTRAILQSEAGGGTALYDTLMFGLIQLQGSGGRRALVVLTDGYDQSSSYGVKSVQRMAARTNIPIYILLLGGEAPAALGFSVTSKVATVSVADSDLRELQIVVNESGGRVFRVNGVRDAAGIYSAIRAELEEQHLLTYRSTSTKPGSEWRKVEVKVRRPDVKVRTISGYYPAD